MLLISLVYSIVLYTVTDFYIKKYGEGGSVHHKFPFIIFQFLFTYSLISTALSVKDTISFTTYRTRFLINKQNKDKQTSAGGQKGNKASE